MFAQQTKVTFTNMDPKSSASRRLLTRRRVSAPTVATGLTATQKLRREQEQATFARAAKGDVAVCSSVHINNLHQRSKMSRRHSSDDAVIRSCLSRFQCSHIPKLADSTFPFRSTRPTTSHYEEGYNGGGWEDRLSLHVEKNEAEIIGDMFQRRGSLPAVSSSDILRPGVVLSSTAFITVRGHDQSKRKSQGILASSVDRWVVLFSHHNGLTKTFSVHWVGGFHNEISFHSMTCDVGCSCLSTAFYPMYEQSFSIHTMENCSCGEQRAEV